MNIWKSYIILWYTPLKFMSLMGRVKATDERSWGLRGFPLWGVSPYLRRIFSFIIISLLSSTKSLTSPAFILGWFSKYFSKVVNRWALLSGVLTLFLQKRILPLFISKQSISLVFMIARRSPVNRFLAVLCSLICFCNSLILSSWLIHSLIVFTRTSLVVILRGTSLRYAL